MDQEPVQNNPIQPQNPGGIPSTPPVLPPRKSRIRAIVISVAVLLALAGGALGYWQYQKQVAIKNQNALVAARNNSNNSQPTSTSTPGDYSTSTLPTGYMATPPVCNNPGPILASKSGTMQWVTPQPLENLILFASSSPYSVYGSESSTLVGHFIAGQYQGGDLLITTIIWEEMGVPSQYYLVRRGNDYTVLGKYSDQLPNATDTKSLVSINEDKNFDLPDLDFPQTLHSQNPAADFTLAANLGFYKNGTQVFCADYYRKAFTDPAVGDVYTDAGTQTVGTGPYAYSPKFGFYVKAPTGMQETYQLNVGFTGKDNVPLVVWNGGKQNSEQYSYQSIGGCGASSFLDVKDVKMADLALAGTTSNGQPVYIYKDSHATELQSMYDEIYTPEGQTKPSYGAFIAGNPIFFWQDPFGQFVRFKIIKYQPMAECGKPVIYLYPERTERVSVQINPLGGMFKSEPAYNSGWNVIADPQSNITNLADGKIYPYLFWEGRGGMYQTPDKGFVVRQTNIHEFLQTKLHELGLNDKESVDFMQFWEPKMQGFPYYFVTFMGNRIMDQLAPLSISPKPNTVIRILMDFEPLSQPISVEGYTIRTPERKGFTVVEWGGVLRGSN